MSTKPQVQPLAWQLDEAHVQALTIQPHSHFFALTSSYATHRLPQISGSFAALRLGFPQDWQPGNLQEYL